VVLREFIAGALVGKGQLELTLKQTPYPVVSVIVAKVLLTDAKGLRFVDASKEFIFLLDSPFWLYCMCCAHGKTIDAMPVTLKNYFSFLSYFGAALKKLKTYDVGMDCASIARRVPKLQLTLGQKLSLFFSFFCLHVL